MERVVVENLRFGCGKLRPLRERNRFCGLNLF
jgi:hypothetical protein